jgi:hypothetical protein
MNEQLSKRLASPLISDVLGQFNEKKITAGQACEALGVGKSRLYLLRSEFLRQRAQGLCWTPKPSGGDHAPAWPRDIEVFLARALRAGYSYAFAASEAGRKYDFDTARSQVRHWAIRNGIVKPQRPPRTPVHVLRWQRGSVGELWQLDATPERWFGAHDRARPLLDMIDDCSRLQTGCAIYSAETVPSYMHFLHGSLVKYGLPLEIYVDQAGIFKGNVEDSVTRLHRRLMFYGISFTFANSPEAKGKIERCHQVWQDRLPPYFALNGVTPLSPLEDANAHIASLADWRNAREEHREIGMTPQEAWDKAVAEGRTKIRPAPTGDPWWHYVWSTWHTVTVGARGYVELPHPIGRIPTQAEPGSRITLCEHLDGTYSLIKERPEHGQFPVLYFTNRPR